MGRVKPDINYLLGDSEIKGKGVSLIQELKEF